MTSRCYVLNQPHHCRHFLIRLSAHVVESEAGEHKSNDGRNTANEVERSAGDGYAADAARARREACKIAVRARGRDGEARKRLLFQLALSVRR